MSFKSVIIRGKNVDSNRYHEGNGASRGDMDYEVSSSMLREFGNCAARWRAGYQPPDSDAKDFGSLLDTLVLTPEQFNARYAIRPETYDSGKDGEKPWNNNATICKEWNKAAEAGNQIPIKKGEWAEAMTAAKRLQDDKTIAALAACSERQVWLTGIYEDEATGLSIPVKALVDYAPKDGSEFSQCLADLKTTRSAKTGEERDTWCFILSENFPPYQTGRSMLSQQKVEFGRMIYGAYLAKYAKCLKTGVWPDYQTGPGVIDGWSLDDSTRWDEMEAMQAMDLAAAIDEPPPMPEETEVENLN
jgi:hypothetical protein